MLNQSINQHVCRLSVRLSHLWIRQKRLKINKI